MYFKNRQNMYSLINITTAIKKKKKRFIGPVKPTTYVTKTCFFLVFVLFFLVYKCDLMQLCGTRWSTYGEKSDVVHKVHVWA